MKTLYNEFKKKTPVAFFWKTYTTKLYSIEDFHEKSMERFLEEIVKKHNGFQEKLEMKFPEGLYREIMYDKESLKEHFQELL